MFTIVPICFFCHYVNLRTFDDESHKPPACSVGQAVAVGHSLLIGQCGFRLLHVWELESVSRKRKGSCAVRADMSRRFEQSEY